MPEFGHARWRRRRRSRPPCQAAPPAERAPTSSWLTLVAPGRCDGRCSNAHAATTRRLEAELKSAGLPPLGWYDVLWPLYKAPKRRLRINQLPQQAVLSRTGLVRLVDRIEAAGLMRREPVPEDGRGAYAAITEAGIETLRRMWPVYARGIEQHFLEPVGPDAASAPDARARSCRVVEGGLPANCRTGSNSAGS
jgi:DNA-binding MarR family transcriptional regulator